MSRARHLVLRRLLLVAVFLGVIIVAVTGVSAAAMATTVTAHVYDSTSQLSQPASNAHGPTAASWSPDNASAWHLRHQAHTVPAAEGDAGLLGGAKPNFSDPAQPPGAGWEWRGNGPPGSSQGSWYNPSTEASLHPDLDHPDPIGPHYDYRAPDGETYRIGPDGTAAPK